MLSDAVSIKISCSPLVEGEGVVDSKKNNNARQISLCMICVSVRFQRMRIQHKTLNPCQNENAYDQEIPESQTGPTHEQERQNTSNHKLTGRQFKQSTSFLILIQIANLDRSQRTVQQN